MCFAIKHNWKMRGYVPVITHTVICAFYGLNSLLINNKTMALLDPLIGMHFCFSFWTLSEPKSYLLIAGDSVLYEFIS
jgi:hypothetical protein